MVACLSMYKLEIKDHRLDIWIYFKVNMKQLLKIYQQVVYFASVWAGFVPSAEKEKFCFDW